MIIKSKMTDKIAVMSSLILTSIITFDTSSVIAGTPSPRSVLKTGEIVETVVKRFAGGSAEGAGKVVGGAAATAVIGTAAAQSITNSGQPYFLYRTVIGYDGRTYYICQNFKNGRPISQEYWCR
ncbi:MAG: hypothetical protein ACKPCG_15820 [Dolichospermum sp.]